MENAESSLIASLDDLLMAGRRRALEDETERAHTERRRRVAALVAENQRRRAERAIERSETERRLAERRERLELEARLRGRADGERERIRIEAAHGARLSELALVHELERERFAASRDRRTARLRAVAALFATAWLLTVALFAASDARSTRVAATHVASPIVATAAELAPAEPIASEATPLATTPLATTPLPMTTPPRVPRPAAPRPASSPPMLSGPAAPPLTTCNDGLGDPCCAFGEIVC